MFTRPHRALFTLIRLPSVAVALHGRYTLWRGKAGQKARACISVCVRKRLFTHSLLIVYLLLFIVNFCHYHSVHTNRYIPTSVSDSISLNGIHSRRYSSVALGSAHYAGSRFSCDWRASAPVVMLAPRRSGVRSQSQCSTTTLPRAVHWRSLGDKLMCQHYPDMRFRWWRHVTLRARVYVSLRVCVHTRVYVFLSFLFFLFFSFGFPFPLIFP